MRKLTVFNSVSVDGYFKGQDGAMDWAHDGQEDPEFQEFVRGNASGGGELLFGRVTYEMMAGFWPTPQAAEMNPEVAKWMNEGRKHVFSRKLKSVDWANTQLHHGDLLARVRELKDAPGAPLTLLGSGSLVPQLARAGLIDEYQLVICPVVLGKGTSLFLGVKEAMRLKLIRSRSFANGKVLQCYAPQG